MDSLQLSFIKNISIFSLVSRLLAVESKKLSNFLYLFYVIVLSKLKLNSVKVKSIDCDHFNDLIAQNKFHFDFDGDINSCALISINTLIALSIKNLSWIKISKPAFNNENTFGNAKNEKSCVWKIKMPPVNEVQEKFDTKTDNSIYYVQCVCVSNVPKDFTLFVSNVKLFNLSNKSNECGTYNKLTSEVSVSNCNNIVSSSWAKVAAVAAVSTSTEFSLKDYEEILNEYFMNPRLLGVNEIFQVNIKDCSCDLRSKIDFGRAQDIFFKVSQISGESECESEKYIIMKTYTTLFLDPNLHSYLPPKVTQYVKSNFCDIGFELNLCPDGLITYMEKLQAMFLPFLKSNKIGVKPIFLLCGSNGSGKNLTLKCVASSFGLHVLYVNCFDLYGATPSLLNGKLNQISTKAWKITPCIVYLKNIEFLGKDQNGHENSRLIDIFETFINDLWSKTNPAYPLFVVGSTKSKPSDLISGIQRLFIETVQFTNFDVQKTFETLRWSTKKLNRTCLSTDLMTVAEKVKGYPFADLVFLTEQAIRFQNIYNNINSQSSIQFLPFCFFDQAIEALEAAYSDSIGAARVPTVHWEDVGGLDDIKEEIILTLNLPLTRPELFVSGLKRSGILFYGPPGTGKTLMAKAVATECNYNFLSVKGPELMNMYVGQSEKNVREVFDRAREATPCIIFFDELDSLAPNRGKSGDSGGVSDRVVSQLLAEMDGLDRNRNVFVIGATNRPDLVDPALLRPGRFDKMFYVGICSNKMSKLKVLAALTRKFALNDDVNLEEIAELVPDNVTGADLYSLCSNAWFSALRKSVSLVEAGEKVTIPLVVTSDDFLDALNQFAPSLTLEDIEYYQKFRLLENR